MHMWLLAGADKWTSWLSSNWIKPWIYLVYLEHYNTMFLNTRYEMF